MDNVVMIQAFKSIVLELYEANILTDYGTEGLATFSDMTEQIKAIHQNIDYKTKNKIVIIKAIDSQELLPTVTNNYEQFINVNWLVTYTHPNIIIEIRGNGEYYITNNIPVITALKQTAIIYKWEINQESFIGKSFEKKLPKLPGVHSWFAISTFKSLDDALEHYKINYALNVSCDKLIDSFVKPGRIYFAPSPEELLRDSLHIFLKARLRENVAVEREQNMDERHPVDIKITWNYTSHMAIIEVKWIGSSYDSNTTKFVDYSSSRANSGAKQLAEYLEMINTSVGNKITRGYLVVFDIRRKKAKPYKTTIPKSDGLHFENIDIIYNPEYHRKRSDFEKPHRFFIRPYSLS